MRSFDTAVVSLQQEIEQLRQDDDAARRALNALLAALQGESLSDQTRAAHAAFVEREFLRSCAMARLIGAQQRLIAAFVEVVNV